MGRYSFRTEAHRIWHKWLIQFSCSYCFKFKSYCSLPLLYSLLCLLLSLFKKAPFNASEWVTLIIYLDTFQAGSKLCPSLLTYKESILQQLIFSRDSSIFNSYFLCVWGGLTELAPCMLFHGNSHCWFPTLTHARPTSDTLLLFYPQMLFSYSTQGLSYPEQLSWPFSSITVISAKENNRPHSI